MEEKIKAVKDILDSGSKEDIEAKTKDLSDSLMKIGEAMNKQEETASDAAGAKGTEGAKDSDEPVEGEVVDDGK